MDLPGSADRTDELARMVSVPSTTRAQEDWEAVERSLGLGLPGDYKHLIEVFGPGSFDGYLLLPSPFLVSRTHHLLDFFQILELAQEAMDTPLERGELPYPLYPDPGGMLPWGGTIDGDLLFWNTTRPDPDTWTVVACDRWPEYWMEFLGSVTGFLVAYLTGELAPPFLAVDMGEHATTFQAHPVSEQEHRPGQVLDPLADLRDFLDGGERHNP
jgi:hypothetical protein